MASACRCFDSCALIPRYGFVEFEDMRDADDAVYELNGKELCGERVVIEHARGPRRDGYGYGGRSKFNISESKARLSCRCGVLIRLCLLICDELHFDS